MMQNFNNNNSLLSIPSYSLSWKIVNANPKYRVCFLESPISITKQMVTIKIYKNKCEILDDLFDDLVREVNSNVRGYGFNCRDVKFQWQDIFQNMPQNSVIQSNITLECNYLIRCEYDLDVTAKFFIKDISVISTFK